MEWFFPFKTTLFASKSVTADLLPPQPPEEDNDDPPAIEDINIAATEHFPPLSEKTGKDNEEETNQNVEFSSTQQQPSVQQHQQVRRRSSLSDLDVLLLRQKREKQTLSSSGLFPVDHKRSALLLAVGSIGSSATTGLEGASGGHALANRCSSIGDMINLKLYGSNRSIVSMTSSIAESVPLETVHNTNNNSSSTGGATAISKPPPTIDEDDDQDQSNAEAQLTVQEKQLASGRLFYSDDNKMDDDNGGDDGEGLGPLSTDAVVTVGVPSPPPLPHQRTPSVTERAQRLSRLIQNRQCRCSRYQQEQDQLITASSSSGGSCPGRPFTAPAANALLLMVTRIIKIKFHYSSHRI